MSKYDFIDSETLKKELLSKEEISAIEIDTTIESQAIIARQELASDVMEYKNSQGLTLEGLAEKLGTSKSQANRILKAKASYSLETIYRICRIIGKKELTLKIF
ncbi:MULTISPECIES: helix-turn-helix domain-containing protein [unclassified Cysteiniphilum]|uniref:helix-turn-helix domain-containing protein n=1 Tax=unclassified Cysteiniphilum TaxID=2610889 RepID=UPI00124489EC|nr:MULTISPECIES: helix-turn-helix transcriptional regulator [unclassified Cysteiniphilum]WHN66285.1 helix-turn-helix transcriptional regulator [Cysteiniphilum sp. QT6929]